VNELAQWLLSLRQEAKLGLPALAEKTKIMAKHLEALEGGEISSLPSKVHARAFALAYAKACGADEEEAIEKVAAAFDGRPSKTAGQAPPLQTPEAAPVAAGLAPPNVDSGTGEAMPPPWRLWLLVAASALLVLFLATRVASWIKAGRPAPAPEAAQEPAASQRPVSSTAETAGEELSLRSRRPTWVVLVIDGKRLPTVFLERDKREYWKVRQKAVMLSGNIGAVRVWWRGENLGYFGGLGERMNGIVFEPGKPWRKDKAEELALPPGVPSQGP
jgi:cytoskeletal protein RodZ